MADIIIFQAYVNAKDEEKKRIKKISMLSSKRDSLLRLLNSINNSIEISMVKKCFGELNQIVGKENIIDNDLQRVIITAIEQYKEGIQHKISELENINCVI